MFKLTLTILLFTQITKVCILFCWHLFVVFCNQLTIHRSNYIPNVYPVNVVLLCLMLLEYLPLGKAMHYFESFKSCNRLLVFEVVFVMLISTNLVCSQYLTQNIFNGSTYQIVAGFLVPDDEVD